MLTETDFQSIQKRIHIYALKLKKYYHEETLEDLQQDLWADVLSALQHYDPQKGKLSHFVENVLRKRYCTMLKRRFRFKRPTRWRKLTFEETIGVEDGLYTKLDMNQVYDRVFLQKHLRKMPRPLRTVLEQAQIYSLRQIADNLHISANQVRKLMHQGQVYLQQERAAQPPFLGRALCAFP